MYINHSTRWYNPSTILSLAESLCHPQGQSSLRIDSVPKDARVIFRLKARNKNSTSWCKS